APLQTRVGTVRSPAAASASVLSDASCPSLEMLLGPLLVVQPSGGREAPFRLKAVLPTRAPDLGGTIKARIGEKSQSNVGGWEPAEVARGGGLRPSEEPGTKSQEPNPNLWFLRFGSWIFRSGLHLGISRRAWPRLMVSPRSETEYTAGWS